MPEGSPIAGAVGKIHSSKPAAKCSGAFEMCLALIEGKFLNGHLQPIYTKQLPLMRNAHLAISSKKKEEYEMRTKPKMWSDLGVPDQLYATALTLAKPETLGWDSRPLILLTRHPLPPMASFPLFFAKDRSSDAQCMPVSSPIAVDEGTLQKLNSFTLKVFLDVFSKEYEATPSQWPYFVAPSKYGHDFDYSGTIDSQGILDWESLDHVHNTGTASWTGNEPDEFFENKFITDFWDGSRKFFVVGRRHDMKPSDTVPNGVPSPSHRAWNKMEKGERSILNYSVSLWSNARDRFKWREDQPVFEAKLLSTRRNLLDDNLGDKDVQYHTCFLIMEPLRISPVS
jgi:endoribonuclease Dicer